MTRPATFVAAAVRDLRGHGGRPSTDAPGAPSWADVAADARALALGLRAAGLGAGSVVHVPPSAAGPAVQVGREVAVLSVGAALAVPGSGRGGEVVLADDGLGTEGARTPLADLLGKGDEGAPDAYEEAVAGIEPGALAVVGDGRGTTHGELLWAHRTVDRWLLPVVGPWGPGRVLALTGDLWGPPDATAALDPTAASATAAPIAAALVGRWWPALAGAQLVDPGPPTTVGGTGAGTDRSTVERVVRASDADVVVAHPATWAVVAATVRARAARSRRGRALLRHGRVEAAGEPRGRGEQAAARLLARRTAPGLVERAGLGGLTLGISLGVPDVASARDLAALCLPVVPTWVDPRVPAPVAAGPVIHPEPAGRWGRPLPGRSIACGGPTTTVCGGDLADGEVELPVRAQTDDRDRVALR